MCAVSYKKGKEPAISAFLQSFKLSTKLQPKLIFGQKKLYLLIDTMREFSDKQKLKWQKQHTFKTMQKTF